MDSVKWDSQNAVRTGAVLVIHFLLSLPLALFAVLCWI